MTNIPPAVTRYWIRDKPELCEGGPTFANIANPDEAVEVVLAADYERLEREHAALRELAEAREQLLIAYRLNDSKRAGKAIDRIEEAQRLLAGREDNK